jgi:hypothetical protein
MTKHIVQLFRINNSLGNRPSAIRNSGCGIGRQSFKPTETLMETNDERMATSLSIRRRHCLCGGGFGVDNR